MTDTPAANIVALLEAVRPLDDAGKPLSDRRWCLDAGVNTGFWRDLRKGTMPRIDTVEALARTAGLSLSALLAGDAAPAPVDALPRAAELAQMLADVQAELPAGTALADYPPFVGPALLTRLRQFAAGHRKAADPPPAPARDTAARSRRATTPTARA
ncbi:hypothetical protein QH494_23940 [Sphingomonas sp. AR_OL41]|uniref:hypothetical protein n=1 Tax=Sphingomonas sp. AR_OL41 TaxID=3042729 RepID=UPI00247FED63|nr:hypothetical protein [Sphingomonas sp. AR_OL41]MDH7975248.1 hypothetical protein [Sphingomonas sp. AR_OL41]